MGDTRNDKEKKTHVWGKDIGELFAANCTCQLSGTGKAAR